MSDAKHRSISPLIVLSLGVVIAGYFFYKYLNNTRDDSSKPLTHGFSIDYNVELIEKVNISPNSRRFRFALPYNGAPFSVVAGRHVLVKANINGRLFARPYTPVSVTSGYFDILVKIYSPSAKFPNGGLMSQYLDSLESGDTVRVTGPMGALSYEGQGRIRVRKPAFSTGEVRSYRKIGMLAAGSGLTPILRVIRASLSDPKDETWLQLLYVVHSESDIWVRQELENYQKEHSLRFQVWYTVSQPDDGWAFSRGHVDAQMMRKHLPEPDKDTAILVCGPPAMIKNLCVPNLIKLGHSEENILSF